MQPESIFKKIIGRTVDQFLEQTVIGSFTRWGYNFRHHFFSEKNPAGDLEGKVFLITGANSGIGLATSLALAQGGAQVLMLCRDPKRAHEAAEMIKAQSPKRTPIPQVFLADLSELESVRKAADEILQKTPILHGVLHNAGNGIVKRTENAQGIESMFCTNVISTFLLTQSLIPLLRSSGTVENPSRVLWVSSGGMYSSGLDVDDLQWRNRPYEFLKVYAENKRAQVVLAEWFSEQEPEPRRIVYHSMHPGWVDTELVRTRLVQFHRWMKSSLRTPMQGADTLIWLASSSEAAQSSGQFWLDRKPRTKYRLKKTQVTSDQKQALIQICQNLIKTSRRSSLNSGSIS